METPFLEGLPTKAKEDPSHHEMKLSPAGHQPSISWPWGLLLYYYYPLPQRYFYINVNDPSSLVAQLVCHAAKSNLNVDYQFSGSRSPS